MPRSIIEGLSQWPHLQLGQGFSTFLSTQHPLRFSRSKCHPWINDIIVPKNLIFFNTKNILVSTVQGNHSNEIFAAVFLWQVF